MPVDYKIVIDKLKNILPFINSCAIFGGTGDLIYSTDNWNIKEDIKNIISLWISLEHKPIIILGNQYLVRICTSDRLVTSSSIGDGHIVGAKDDERIIITHIEPDGIIPFTTTEIARILELLRVKEPYMGENRQLGMKFKIRKEGVSNSEKVNQNNFDIELLPSHKHYKPELDLPYTARLMAYYRAQEFKRVSPLIIDPFAERLAGNLSPFLNDHIRFSEMDYPIVRSYYIEKNLLTLWCNTQKKSQIILLGAGLDTRVYRFKPLHKNKHIIYEIDFPQVIHYKEEILKDEKPLCGLVRLSANLTNPDWISNLLKSKYSTSIPTFWVLEGLAYYIEKHDFNALLLKIAKISTETSQIFIDIMQLSRWYSFPYASEGIVGDPFSRHIKWGLDIKSVPSFFIKTGWMVSCSFADKHDQGRNVGQRAMIFIHGEQASTI